MMIVKLIKEYGDYTVGNKYEVDDADAQTLIDDAIAEKVEPEAKKEIDLTELSKEIAATVTEQLKVERKIPAQPKDSDADRKGPWNTFGQFAKSVMGGMADQKLSAYCKVSGMSEVVNADGGFLIPPEFSMALLAAISEAGVLAPKCRNFPVNNNLTLPFVNRTTMATSWTGGVTIYKPCEGVAKTSSKPPLAQAELKLYKMAALIYATDELLSDSPIALETFLTTLCSTEFALTKDEDIINGSGAGEALGVMNAPCLVSVTKETNQVAQTIVFDNVAKMWSRMYSPSRRNAVWLINQDCMTQIAKMSITVGTGGAPVMVVNAATDIPQSIFGAPIIWSPHCQTLGTTGDIILGDFNQYVTITKAGMGEMETATSIHIKFVEDETAFRFVLRFDGQPWWSSAVTPKHGTNTVSPFVALATRS